MVFGVPCYYSIIQPILTDTQYKGSLNNNQAKSNNKPSAVVEACTRFRGGRGKAIPPISVIWKTWLRPHRRVSLWIRSSRMSRYCWETSIPDREQHCGATKGRQNMACSESHKELGFAGVCSLNGVGLPWNWGSGSSGDPHWHGHLQWPVSTYFINLCFYSLYLYILYTYILGPPP